MAVTSYFTNHYFCPPMTMFIIYMHVFVLLIWKNCTKSFSNGDAMQCHVWHGKILIELLGIKNYGLTARQYQLVFAIRRPSRADVIGYVWVFYVWALCLWLYILLQDLGNIFSSLQIAYLDYYCDAAAGFGSQLGVKWGLICSFDVMIMQSGIFQYYN